MDGQSNRGKFLKRAGLVILMGACAMLISSQASAVLIDHWKGAFDNGAVTGSGGTATVLAVTSTNPYAVNYQTGIADVLGGQRKTTLVWSGGTSADAQAISASTNGSFVDTLLSYSNGAGITSTLDSFYDGAGGLGLGDLTVGGASFMVIRLVKADLNAKLTITVTDADSSASVTDTVLVAITNPGMDLFFPFASFAGVDFTSVKSINLELTQASGDSVDYFVDNLRTDNPVPEPLTMLGMFLGLGGVGAYIRKRRMA